jgi:hypothetical protein
VFAVERQQLLHSADALLVEPLFSAGANAGQVAQGKGAQSLRQNVERQSHQAVGLFHVAGNLGQKAIGGQTDGTAHHGADRFQDARFHALAQLKRGQQRPLTAHQPAGHLVDGADGGDRYAALHCLHNAVVILHVEFVPCLDEDDLRAHAPGFGHDGAGLHAKGFGLVAGRNAAGGVGHHRHNAYGTPAQIRPHILLDGSKVGVQIDKQPVDEWLSQHWLSSDRVLQVQSAEFLRPRLFRGGQEIRNWVRRHG